MYVWCTKFQVLPPEYLLPSQWVPGLAPIYVFLPRAEQVFTLQQTIVLRDRRGAASLRYRNSAEITVLMCEQKLLSGMVFVPAQKLSSIVDTALVEIRNDHDDDDDNVGDGNDNVRLAKQQFCTCSTRFWYISLPSMYDHDVKFPYSMCYGGRKHTTASFRFIFKTWVTKVTFLLPSPSPMLKFTMCLLRVI